MNPQREQIGVMIVDHGSKRDESNQMLEQFVERFAERGGYDIVEPAHMELAEPGIASAFDRCIARGATRVIVVPYFLGPGKHWDRDIPSLTADAARQHPGVAYRIAEPIGLHPKMIDVIRDRADECR
jgi:sirohydrochlorin ferrochelatase